MRREALLLGAGVLNMSEGAYAGEHNVADAAVLDVSDDACCDVVGDEDARRREGDLLLLLVMLIE